MKGDAADLKTVANRGVPAPTIAKEARAAIEGLAEAIANDQETGEPLFWHAVTKPRVRVENQIPPRGF